MINIKNNIFSVSAEYVGTGHPDKIADQIADAIVDNCINNEKDIQVACEVLVSKNLVVVTGEFFFNKTIDIKDICISVLKKYNYDTNKFDFHIKTSQQSTDIRNSVVKTNKYICSGDQSIVYGFATNETPEYLPLSHVMARDIVQKCIELINNKTFDWANYDMKSLITLNKINESNKYELDTLIFSIQHSESVSWEKVKKDIEKYVIKEIVEKKYGFVDKIPNLFINSSKKFVIGGLDADSGATNRKLIIDTASVNSKHGGGGLSGKDLSKIDRLGSYYARWICKNIVAANICEWIEIKLVYFLGADEAITYSLNKNINCSYSDEEIIAAIKAIFPTKINEIIELFLSKKICYEDLAANGHFGRTNLDLPWESLAFVDKLKKWFIKS